MTRHEWLGFAVILSVCAMLAATAYVEDWRDRTRLRRVVFDNLDSAAENGYFAPGEHLHEMTSDEIAYDIITYAADCEGKHWTELAPYVRQWLNKGNRI